MLFGHLKKPYAKWAKGHPKLARLTANLHFRGGTAGVGSQMSNQFKPIQRIKIFNIWQACRENITNSISSKRRISPRCSCQSRRNHNSRLVKVTDFLIDHFTYLVECMKYVIWSKFDVDLLRKISFFQAIWPQKKCQHALWTIQPASKAMPLWKQR